MSLSELKSYTFKAKYANYNREKKRRETWHEAVGRSEEMMLRKYNNIDEYIKKAYSAAKRKEVLGAQRALQFAGPGIERKNERMYNCSFSYADRPRFFQESMFLLLCGCGVGFSVQKHHINRLPKLVDSVKEELLFQVPDTIEGWADAVGALIYSYLASGTTYQGKKIVFDYSLIRPAGSTLSYTTGKAPGPKPLENALEKVRNILNKALAAKQEKLKPINVYDIIMHSSDAVLAGGVRRSATICLFSEDDKEMASAKTGNWFVENPQRGRSNNSAVLLRDDISKESFTNLMNSVKEFGEPGFVWVDSLEHGVNPCQPSSAPILTMDGLRQFKDIDVGSWIWSETGWTKVTKKWSTGIKPVFKYKTNAGYFLGTENHRLVSNGIKIEAKDCETVDVLCGNTSYEAVKQNPQAIMDGLVLGDGTCHKASNNLIGLLIGKDDQDYLDENSEVRNEILEFRPGVGPTFYEVKTTITPNELVHTYERKIPERYLFGKIENLCGFLRGLYSANGSIVNNRVTLKTASAQLREDVQLALSSLGIRSYYTTNKPTTVEFSNGIYECRESYDINISVDVDRFAKIIGFIQKYKTEKLAKRLNKQHNTGKTSYDIHTVEYIGEEEVYDITVDNVPHTYWTGGLNVSNCAEISFFAYDIVDKVKFNQWQKENGYKIIDCPPEDIGLKSGWEFCNLSTINGGKTDTKEKFLEACVNAAIIGTLQAGFTDFPYLGETTENIVRREALLGVSITGVMDNPQICLDPEIQKEGALLVIKTNQEIAKLIGINQAARTTTLKPEGSSSCVLGTSSGIHPHHAKRYIRSVQANTSEPLYQYFKGINPQATERSVWSANNSDDVISFCIVVPDGAKTKNQLSAIDLLKYVKSTYESWITNGKVESLCTQHWLNHNVSNTITVKPTEWEEVTDFIYDNRKFFCGISLLPESGDKDYPQAPFTAIYTPKEMINHYGDCAVFVSGLIERALELYDDNLWKACDILNGIGEKPNGTAKKEFFFQAKKFAVKYLEGNVRKLTYLMKDVYNWKKWLDLNRTFNPVNYDEFIEEEDTVNINHQADSACGGNGCEVIRT